MSQGDSGGSVSHWLDGLKGGDSQATAAIWNRYFHRLVSLARSRMKGPARADAEDVALSAIASLCRGAERGRFPRLDDRDDLWKVLFVITVRKVSREAERGARLKRGGESGPVKVTPDALESFLSQEPSPETLAILEDQFEKLLGILGDEQLRRVALLKFEGHTNEEIAADLGRTVRTAERKLELIRACWEEFLD